jgi:hypothetical protein
VGGQKFVSARYVVLALFLVAIWANHGMGSAQESSLPVQATGSIFSIGKENRSYFGFRYRGWADESEFHCTVGVDCIEASFPRRLYRHNRSDYARTHDDEGVESVLVTFHLAQDVPKAVLRLARAGTETTLVSLDGGQPYTVTGAMLGSADGTEFGVYDLQLGELSPGEHTLLFTVADDGQGNGSYSWDSIALFAR